MTFVELVRLEPALAALAAGCSAARPKKSGRLSDRQLQRAVRRWYAEFKPRLVRLVGVCRRPPGMGDYPEPAAGTKVGGSTWYTCADLMKNHDAYVGEYERAVAELAESDRAGERVLASSSAYDVAYNHLYFVLTGERPGCPG